MKMSHAPSSSALAIVLEPMVHNGSLHWWVIVGCKPYSAAISDTMRLLFTAPSATQDLKPES